MAGRTPRPYHILRLFSEQQNPKKMARETGRKVKRRWQSEKGGEGRHRCDGKMY